MLRYTLVSINPDKGTKMNTVLNVALNVRLPTPEEIERPYEDLTNTRDRHSFQCGAYAARYRQACEYLEVLRAELRATQQEN